MIFARLGRLPVAARRLGWMVDAKIGSVYRFRHLLLLKDGFNPQIRAGTGARPYRGPPLQGAFR